MAKTTKKASPKPKKVSSKYSKLAAVAAKELTAKKAALVRAEKALAKAQKSHQELLGEVARLDMLDRSLKALINGTEPPQSVRYVYTYPQWVWNPNYGYWYNNGTITIGNTYPYQTSYTTTGYNSQVTGLYQNAQTVNTGYSSGTTTLGAITSTAGNLNSGTTTFNCSTLGGDYTDSGTSAFTLTTPTTGALLTATNSGPTWTTSTAGDFTVDLSTGAADPEVEKEEDPLGQLVGAEITGAEDGH